MNGDTNKLFKREFVGVYDSTGKKIYEGDFLARSTRHGEIKVKVQFHHGAFGAFLSGEQGKNLGVWENPMFHAFYNHAAFDSFKTKMGHKKLESWTVKPK